MSLSNRSRPSPAMVVAVVALSLALAGSAVAGTGALDKAITKSKVKQISKKQANKQIDKRAPGLSVANAVNAQNAVNAENAVTAGNGAVAYGNFAPSGAVRPGAFNMNDLTVSTAAPSIYCEDQPFKTVVATGAIAQTGAAANASALDRQALAGVGVTPADVGCPANTEWIYATFDSTGGGGTVPAFFQVIAH